MTVYVDRFMALFDRGKWAGGGHLLTSDLDELHRFAVRIGLRRAWFQDKTFPHYDLTRSKRIAALHNGAVSIEPGGFPDDLLVRCRAGGYEPYAARRARTSPDVPDEQQDPDERHDPRCPRESCECALIARQVRAADAALARRIRAAVADAG